MQIDFQPVEEKAKIDFQPSEDFVDKAVGKTPQELSEEGHWVQGGLLQTAKDVITIPSNFVNQFAYNAPRSIQRTVAGSDIVPMEPQSKVAHALAHTAGVAGAVLSPINKLGIAAKGATVGGKLLGMAAQGAIYSPTENFGDVGQRAGQAVLGAGLGAAGNAVSKFKPATEWAAQRVYNSVIKPLKRDFAYAKNPGRGLANEGVTFGSMEEGEKKVGDLLEQRTAEMEQTLQGRTEKIGVEEGVNAAIAEAKKKAAETNNEALLKEIGKIEQALKNNLVTKANKKGVEEIVAGTKRNLSEMSLTDALGLKRTIGKLTNYTGNPSDFKPLNALKQKLYRVIRDEMEAAAPETADMNETLADLIGASSALKHRAAIEARQGLLGLTGMLGTGTSVVSAFAHSPEGIIGGLTMIGIDKALKSPAVMTNVAATLGKMSRMDVGRVMNAVPWLQEAMQKAGGKAKEFMDAFDNAISAPVRGVAGRVGVAKENAIRVPETLKLDLRTKLTPEEAAQAKQEATPAQVEDIKAWRLTNKGGFVSTGENANKKPIKLKYLSEEDFDRYGNPKEKTITVQKYLYHDTAEDNIDSIIKNGIDKEHSGGVVYLSGLKDLNFREGGPGKLVKLRVRSEQIPKNKISIDETFGGGVDSVAGGSYAVEKSFLPSQLEIQVNNKWIPLTEYANKKGIAGKGGFVSSGEIENRDYYKTPLYHGTRIETAKKILREGFKVGSGKTSEVGGAPKNYGDAIYLTANKKYASSFATGRALDEHFSVIAKAYKSAYKETGDSDFLVGLLDEIPGFEQHLEKLGYETYDLYDFSDEVFKEAVKFSKSFSGQKGGVIRTLVNKDANLFLVKGREQYAQLVEKSEKEFPKLQKGEAIKKYVTSKGYDGIISSVDGNNNEYVIYNGKKLLPSVLSEVGNLMKSQLGLMAGTSTAVAAGAAAGNANNVDMEKIYQIESSGNANAWNKAKDARGLGQITPVVLKEWNQANPKDKHIGRDLFKPEVNKKIAEWYMNKRIPQMLKAAKKQDTLDNRLIAYNAGVRRVGKQRIPKETQDYLKKYKEAK